MKWMIERRQFWAGMALLLVVSHWNGLRADDQADDQLNQSHHGDSQLTADQLKFFESKIRPVLVRECYGCHSSQVGQVRGGLWLDTAEATRSGGDSGPAIVPGNLEESLLWNALNHVDFEMPPRRKLSEEVLADFRTWIEMGAPDPRIQQESHVKSSITQQDIEAGRHFWSFQRPELPKVPSPASDWASSDIDRFLLDRLSSQNMSPAEDASSAVVLRRLCFDLIGLPPTPRQLEQFESEWQQDPQEAIRSMADRLLEQPQFGERWGRHWLDLARYAESTGREVNLTFSAAWRYRDYVIEAFNEDKPYDRFVQEQIAGDLLPVRSDEDWAENLVATGFLALGPKALIERNPRQFELDLVDEQIDVTTRVMLGVSVACARCHDHKFDPIPQADYYALSGIFQSMSTHYGTFRTLQNRRPSNLIELPVQDAEPLQQAVSREQLEDWRDELRDKQREMQAALVARRMQQSRQNQSSNQRPNQPPQARVLQAAQLSVAAGVLQSMLDSYDDQGQPLALCMGVQDAEPTTARLLERGEFNRPGQEVARGFPQVLCQEPVTIDAKSSGRLEFARWVGSRDNPLTARVMVNRVWLHLFGNGIVRTPEDFGATGSSPTHPELLDYLAVDFMENGWSIKHLIRQIVSTRAYRMSSQFNADHFEKDPENRLLWRRDPKRLEAEAIRDAILAASGELDLQPPKASLVALAGPSAVRDGSLVSSAPPPREQRQETSQAQRTRATAYAAGGMRPNLWSLDQPSTYRSVYLPIVRESIPRTMDVFDFAEASMVIGQRETSNTPDQGLFFLNNEFVIQQADAMAQRLLDHSDDLRTQVKQAFLLTYGRTPSHRELGAVVDFYRGFQPEAITVSRGRRSRPAESGADLSLKKLSAVCQSLMGAAEFRYLD